MPARRLPDRVPVLAGTIGDLWINILQAQEAHLSTRGKQIIVANSGHMIPFERPDAVVSAIHEVWAAARPQN